MRILMVTLELADPVFSGNGVYGRTIVEALVSEPGTTVDVVCGSPAEGYDEATPPFTSHAKLTEAVQDSRVRVSRIPLPIWEKVDRSAAWAEFGDGAAVSAFVTASQDPYDLILGVDWTAARAVATLKNSLPGAPRVVHMNFRVFFAQLELLQEGVDDRDFYTCMEREACAQADSVIALTTADGASLAGLLPCPEASGASARFEPAILNPPLRPDIAALALDSASSSKRRFITICARISEEKRVLEYVRIVAAARETLKQYGLVPLLIGAKTSPEYADRCIGALKDAFPGEQSEIREFGGPEELAEVWQETFLNIHTAMYEAYGMTIVEAAAFGVPTLMHNEETAIGAKDLLPQTARFETDMANPVAAADALVDIVRSSGDKVQTTRTIARDAALSWDLAAFRVKLAELLRSASAAPVHDDTELAQ